MQLPRILVVLFCCVAASLTACGGGSGGGGDNTFSSETLQARNASEVIISGGKYHALGQSLRAVVSLPEGAGPFPGVVIVHGSGGIFKEGSEYGSLCTEEVESKYAQLRDMLVAKGVAVIMPDSFSSRDPRFCEDNSNLIDFAPSNYDRESRRIALRTYDLLAATNYFCDLEEVDCDHIGFVGTSNGGSIIFHYLHEHLEYTFEDFFDRKAADLTGVPYVPIPADRPMPKFAQAISPGCLLNGAIRAEADADDLPGEDIEELYYPHPGTVLFLDVGENDGVPNGCTTAFGKPGQREIQAAEVEQRLNIAPADSRYHVATYANGEHELLGQAPYGDQIRTQFMDRVDLYLK